MNINKAQALKIAKAALYVGISAAIGSVIAFVEGNPEKFGIYAPIVNITLVTLKQLFSEDKK